MKVGFIGFGEAASSIAAGLHEAGVEEITANDAFETDVTRTRAQQSGVRLLDDPSLFSQHRPNVLFCLVPGSEGILAATRMCTIVDWDCVYADLTSCSPRVKREIGEVLAQDQVAYASVSVMSAVPPQRHHVPMLADGPGAAKLIEAMTPLGMNIKKVDGPLGCSAAVKMFRSVIVKGIEALLLESLTAAEQIGVGDDVLQSVEDSFGNLTFPQLADYLVERNYLHGLRRAHELREAAETIVSSGVEPHATVGAAKRLEACAALPRTGEVEKPGSYKDVLRLWQGSDGYAVNRD